MLGVLRRRNPYYPPGTWVECFDDGCQKVEIEQVEHRLRVVRHIGIVIPKDALAPYLMQVQKRGLDK